MYQPFKARYRAITHFSFSFASGASGDRPYPSGQVRKVSGYSALCRCYDCIGGIRDAALTLGAPSIFAPMKYHNSIPIETTMAPAQFWVE